MEILRLYNLRYDLQCDNLLIINYRHHNYSLIDYIDMIFNYNTGNTCIAPLKNTQDLERLIPGICLVWVLVNRSYLNHENSVNSVFSLYLNKD
jgi:hypothetical protein